MSSTQKALFLENKFGNFVVKDTEIYTPGPGELLIQVKSTSLNPADWKIQKNGIIVRDFPAIIGTDIAGDVIEVGKGVTEFRNGDRVFAQGIFERKYASFQQYTLIKASSAARIPSNLSYDDVSPLPVALSTAWIGLYNSQPNGLGLVPPSSEDGIGKYAGNPFVVLGASSSVGQVALQLAKISGFSPIIATASPKHTEYLKSLGATHVFDRSLPSTVFVEEVNRITGDKPLQYGYDGVSTPETQQTGLDLLSHGGQLVIVLFRAVEEIPEVKSLVKVVATPTLPQNIQIISELYHDAITGLLEKGLIKANRVEVLPLGLAGIPGGLIRLEKNQISGVKLVAHPHETPELQ